MEQGKKQRELILNSRVLMWSNLKKGKGNSYNNKNKTIRFTEHLLNAGHCGQFI